MYCCSEDKINSMVFIRNLTFCCLRTLKNVCPLITSDFFNLNNLDLLSTYPLLAPSHAILSLFFCHCEPRRGEAIFCHGRKDCFVGQRAPSSRWQELVSGWNTRINLPNLCSRWCPQCRASCKDQRETWDLKVNWLSRSGDRERTKNICSPRSLRAKPNRKVTCLNKDL